VKAKGAQIGVLACCDHQADFAARRDRPGIWHLDLNEESAVRSLLEAVENLAARVEHVVVGLHWQPNWAPQVEKIYRRLAERLVASGARVVWGHSPHHLQGVEWIGRSAVIYSAGGLVDDYAVDPALRNDRSLLFHLTLGPEGVERVRGYPIELEFAHPRPAGGEVRRWIEQFFRGMCAAVGSRVEMRDGWLEVLPEEAEPSRGGG
jgi:poly-gamma-glutamate synthesis protein (capsule biosynthesis protein)